MSQSLTPKKQKRLAVLLADALAAGNAIALIIKEIRDDELYIETHDTFEGFVNDEFNLTARRAYQMIDHAEFMAKLPVECEQFVHKESLKEGHTRALSKVPQDQLAGVLESALSADGASLTAKAIKKAVSGVLLEAEIEESTPNEGDSGDEYEDHDPPEATGEPETADTEAWKKAKAGIIATASALMRSVEDMNDDRPDVTLCDEALDVLKDLVRIMGDWK